MNEAYLEFGQYMILRATRLEGGVKFLFRGRFEREMPWSDVRKLIDLRAPFRIFESNGLTHILEGKMTLWSALPGEFDSLRVKLSSWLPAQPLPEPEDLAFALFVAENAPEIREKAEIPYHEMFPGVPFPGNIGPRLLERFDRCARVMWERASQTVRNRWLDLAEGALKQLEGSKAEIAVRSAQIDRNCVSTVRV